MGTPLQTGTTLFLIFLQARCCSWCPINSVKAPKANVIHAGFLKNLNEVWVTVTLLYCTVLQMQTPKYHCQKAKFLVWLTGGQRPFSAQIWIYQIRFQSGKNQFSYGLQSDFATKILQEQYNNAKSHSCGRLTSWIWLQQSRYRSVLHILKPIELGVVHITDMRK